MANLASIASYGILSHARARNVPHESIAMEAIQDLRSGVVVPNGQPLHDYANLYFCVRNPMMYKRLSRREHLCVLRVCHHVLDLPNVVITSGNASSGYTKFEASPGGLRNVDAAMTHAAYWNIGDDIDQMRRKSAKCAEVLVPGEVEVKFILGAYVCSNAALARFNNAASGLVATVNSHLFFA